MKTRKQFELLLITVISIRATSFMFMKICVETMAPFNLLAVRFTIAFLVLVAVFAKRIIHMDKKDIVRGLILGGGYFAMMTAETLSLQTATSQSVALIENTAVVLVPIFVFVAYRTKLKLIDIGCAALALVGVMGVLLKDFQIVLNIGIFFAILSAIFYAISIILTAKVSKEGDAMMIGVFQIGFMALFSIIATFLFEAPVMPASSSQWLCILFLAIICSSIGWALQPVAQQGTTPERAGLFCAISPAIAALVGAVFLKESLGVTGIVGMVLILAALCISSVASAKKEDEEINENS